MLSPYKLYKADKKVARTAVTQGPRGKPAPGCSGTLCYNHYNVDWTAHRLVPAIASRSKPGGPTRKIIGAAAARTAQGTGMEGQLKRRPKITLQAQSPRWGEGVAPSRHARKIVPLPPKKDVEVSKTTKVAAAAAAAGAGVQHRQSKHQGIVNK